MGDSSDPLAGCHGDAGFHRWFAIHLRPLPPSATQASSRGQREGGGDSVPLGCQCGSWPDRASPRRRRLATSRVRVPKRESCVHDVRCIAPRTRSAVTVALSVYFLSSDGIGIRCWTIWRGRRTDLARALRGVGDLHVADRRQRQLSPPAQRLARRLDPGTLRRFATRSVRVGARVAAGRHHHPPRALRNAMSSPDL